MTDPLLAGGQTAIDRDQPGFTVSHYIVVVGIERLTADGIETGVGFYIPDGQAGYVTEGLLAAGDRLRQT